ncbi:MAG: hypothetical protein OEZ13_00675 [Spirochaetia bacterium]|nr:hypothetical protein [Spirochaetia bacterium]
MEILINDQPLDFELKDIISLSEIIDHVSEWAGKNNYYILDYKVQTESKSLKPMSDEIDKIEIEVGDIKDLTLATVNELLEYLNRVGSFLAERLYKNIPFSLDEKEQLQEGVDCIEKAFIVLISPEPIEEKSKNMKAVVSDLANLAKDIDSDEGLMKVLQNMTLIRYHLLDLSRQYRFKALSPEELEKGKQKFLSQLESVDGLLEKITSEFTIGKEAHAILALNDLMEGLFEGINVLYLTGTAIETSEKITVIFQDLMKAIEEKDMVTAADIIDFDLRDAIKEYQTSS